MAAPIIDSTVSVLAFVRGEFYNVQLAVTSASDPATGWELMSGSLPPGMELDEDTGLISGAPNTAAEGSVWVAQIVASNGAGDSEPLKLTFGVERRAAEPDGSAEITIDLFGGAVTSPAGVDQFGRAVIFLKRGDVFPLSIGFKKGADPVPLGVFLVKVGLKERDTEKEFVISSGDLHEAGDDYAPRYLTTLDLTASKLKSILADYETDGGTSFDALCEVYFEYFHDLGGEEPAEMKRTSQTFVARFVRDLIPN